MYAPPHHRLADAMGKMALFLLGIDQCLDWLLGLLWHHPSGKGKRCHITAGCGWKFQLHCGLKWHWGDEEWNICGLHWHWWNMNRKWCYHTWDEWKSWPLHDIHWYHLSRDGGRKQGTKGIGMPHYWMVKVDMWMWVVSFSWSVDWCRVVIFWKFYVLDCLSLVTKSKLVAFLCAFWYFWVAGFFSMK